MASDLKPSTWFGSGYAAGTSYIQLNTNDAGGGEAFKLLKQLTNANAVAASGDVRSVIFALAEAAYQAYKAQADLSNRSTQMTVSRNLSGTDKEIFTYTMQFVLTQPNNVLVFPSE